MSLEEARFVPILYFRDHVASLAWSTFLVILSEGETPDQFEIQLSLAQPINLKLDAICKRCLMRCNVAPYLRYPRITGILVPILYPR